MKDLTTNVLLQKWLVRGKSSTPSSPVMGESSRKKGIIQTFTASGMPTSEFLDISNRQSLGAAKTMRRKTKRLSGITSKLTQDGKSKVKTKNKRLTYDNLSTVKTSVLGEIKSSSSKFNTKSTMGPTFLREHEKGIFDLQNCESEVQPVGEIFDEENKENLGNSNPKGKLKDKLKVLSKHKSSIELQEEFQSSKRLRSIRKDLSGDSSLLVGENPKYDDGNFSIKMSDSASNRLDVMKDLTSSSKMYSTNLSIDPNS